MPKTTLRDVAEFTKLNAVRRVFGMLHVRRTEMVMLVVLAVGYAILEGFGVGLLLPVLQYAESGGAAFLQSAGGVWGQAIEWLSRFGIQMNLATLLVMAFVPIMLRQVVYFLNARYSAVVQNRAIVRLRVDAFEAFVHSDMSFLAGHKQGDLISVLTGQVDAAGAALIQCLRLIAIVCLVVIYAIALLLVSPLLTAMAVVAVGLMSYLARTSIARSRDYGIALSAKSREAYASFMQRMGVVRLVKMLGQEDVETANVSRLSNALMEANVRIAVSQALIEVTVDPGLMLGAFLVLFVGIQYLHLSLAGLSLFLFVLLRLNQKAKEFSTTRQQVSAYLESLLFVERTTADARESRRVLSGPVAFEGLRKEIVLRDVAFVYESEGSAREGVLKSINAVFAAGSTTAIVGRSGAGKSTMVELVPRLRDATSGSVLIDGTDVRDYDLRSLRRRIGYMTQEAMLLDDSIRNNLLYGLERQPTDEEIRRALEGSFAAAFVDLLPDGLETLIGDRGVRLSGGERQRLGLARVLLQDPDILILDEPTSALDSESENAIQAALDRVHGVKTLIVVAHRLSTVQKAGQILVLDAGRIVECGTHAELLAAGGVYRRLFKSQLH